MSYQNGPPKIVTDGLVLMLDPIISKSYPGSGNTIYDLSGRGNNGTINGATYWSDGKGCFYFGGNDNVTLTKTVSQMNVSNTAMSCFVYANKSSPPYVSNVQGIVGFSSLTLSIKTTGGMFLDVYSNNSTRYIPSFLSTISLDTWYCLCFTISNNIVKLYTNGSLVETTTMDNNLSDIQSLAFSQGNGYGYYRFKGKIGPTYMYNKPLSENEVSQNYNATKYRFGL